MPSSYLVTGGAGFIGSNFVRHVVANTDATVTVLDLLTYAGDPRTLEGLPEGRVRLVQGDIADPDVVEEVVAPLAVDDGVLVHFAADWRFAEKWHFIADLDGLAGGPGRAIDLALKIGDDINDRWSVTAGYRGVEGGADVDEVYNFAWFNTALVAFDYRF